MTKQRKYLQSVSAGPSFTPDPVIRAIRTQWRAESARLLAPIVLAGSMAMAPAHAATIDVTAGAVDNLVNGNCSLVEAVLSANTDTGVDNCTAGSGDDTLVLPPGSTFSFVSAYSSSENALPLISTGVTIEGGGSTLTGAGAIPPEAEFRIFEVLGKGGDLTLLDTVVSGGLAENGGNILVNKGGVLTLSQSAVMDNRGDSKYGGGIANFGTADLVNSTISGNDAKYGGGLFNAAGATLTLTDSTVSDNTVKYVDFCILLCIGREPGVGGGILNDGNLTVTGSTISDNDVKYSSILPGPGGYAAGLANYGTATITNSTISGNSSDWRVGGIANVDAGVLTLINVTIADNDAKYVGGLSNDSSASLELRNTLVTGNTDDSGSFDYDNCYDRGAVLPTLQKRPRVPLVGRAVMPKVITASGVNLSEDPGNCGGFAPTPLAGPINLDVLADNGGPTQTHALLAGSVAINAGAACDVATDQRGFSRDAICDVGAFEFGAEPLDGGPVRRGVSISFNNNLILESGGENGDAGRAEVRVRMPDPLPNDVVVTLGYEGDAILGLDFTGPSELTIPSGKESIAGEIVAINDTIDEPLRERLRIVARSVEGTSGEGRRAIAAIIDDDPTPPGTVPGLNLLLPAATLGLSTTQLPESGGSATVTARLAEAARWPVAITLNLAGTATSVADYTLGAERIVIQPGDLAGSTTLTAIDDAVDEVDETVTIAATAFGAALADSSLTATILDNDTAQGGPPVVPDGSAPPLTSVIGGNLVDLVVGAALRDARVVPGDSNVPAAAGTVSNPGATAITVNRVHATLAAFGGSLADVTGARLYLDSDGDGMLEVTDALLAQTSAIGQGGALAFDLAGLTLNPGQSVRVLVALDFANQFALGKSLMLAGTGMGLPLLGLAGWRRRRWLMPVSIAAGLGVSACSDDGAIPMPQSQQRVYQLTLDQVDATGGTAVLSDTVSVVLISPR